MKTKKQIEKKLEEFETLFLALDFEDCNEGIDSEGMKILLEWLIQNNSQGLGLDACGEQIVSLQWVLDCEIKLPKIDSYKLEEFVKTLKA